MPSTDPGPRPIRTRTALVVIGAAIAVAFVLFVVAPWVRVPVLRSPLPPSANGSVATDMSPAASTPTLSEMSKLVSHSWQAPGSDFRVFFTADSATISTGCGGTSLPVSLSSDAVLPTSGWGSSQGSCENTMKPELLTALSSGGGWQFKLVDHRLTLTVGSGQALTLLDAGSGPTATLPIPANTAAGHKALASSRWVLPGTAGTLEIADGRIDGAIAACNSIHGPVDISSTTLTVTHPDGPVVPCPRSSADTGFSMSSPLRWHLEGGLLLLTNSNNHITQWVPGG